MNKKIQQLVQSINAELESKDNQIAGLRQQLSKKSDNSEELAKKEAHIEKLRARVKELESELRTASVERDHAIAKLARLKKLTGS